MISRKKKAISSSKQIKTFFLMTSYIRRRNLRNISSRITKLPNFWHHLCVLLLLSFEHPCSDSTLVLTKEAFFTEQLAIKARLFSPLPSKSWLILVVLYGTSLHHVYVVIVSNISLSNHVHSKMGNRKQVLTKLSCLSRFTTSKPINIFL